MSSGQDDARRDLATRLVRLGRRPEWTGPAINVPVWRSSTLLFDSVGDVRKSFANNRDGQFFYGRRGMPTQWALADALTALEAGAEGTMLYPSGLAAIAAALLSVVKPGDRLLLSDNAYDPSRNFGTTFLERMNVKTVFFDPLDLDGFTRECDAGVACVLLESPGSGTMEVCDVPALAEIAHRHDAIVLIDNTWAGPTGFQALEHGCDGSILALTKHVGGHSDLMMGSVTANARFYPQLRKTAQLLGQVISPDDAALALRGLRTLGIRLKQQSETALSVARWLRERPEVAIVLYPMLDGAPGHSLWQRDFTGGCGLFTFILKGGDEAARARLMDSLELFGIGFSWGGYESLAMLVTPDGFRDAMQWPPDGLGLEAEDRYGVRLSIGLESADDLISDLEQAFTRMKDT